MRAAARVFSAKGKLEQTEVEEVKKETNGQAPTIFIRIPQMQALALAIHPTSPSGPPQKNKVQPCPQSPEGSKIPHLLLLVRQARSSPEKPPPAAPLFSHAHTVDARTFLEGPSPCRSHNHASMPPCLAMPCHAMHTAICYDRAFNLTHEPDSPGLRLPLCIAPEADQNKPSPRIAGC